MVASCTGAHANPMILVDAKSGIVMEHQEAFQKWYPASLTKMMTAYVAFSALRAKRVGLTTVATVSSVAASQAPSKMYYKPGSKLTLDSALKIMLVKSANDMAVVVAETVGGTMENFVDQMNAQARVLGMSQSHFINPNGLPGAGQYTTARDLAVLAMALRRDFPEYAGYFDIEAVNTGKRTYPNSNMLIGRFDGVDGMKTGYICASGFNQVSTATRNGRTVVSVVLGADSLSDRTDLSANLLQKGLTERASGVRLASLAPYGAGRDSVSDISAKVCSASARKARLDGRDENGRLKLTSPYIHEMDHPPQAVFAGLIPGLAPDNPAAVKGTDIADVPIPIPRPTF
nr:D-alanyl-D-alanine carboxypeptidase family protein [Rhizobium halophytocola]